MRVGLCLNELDVNVNAVTRPLHASFENVSNAEFARNFGKILRRAFIMCRRSARDYSEPADLRECGDDFVLDTLGEEGVFFVRTQILERQNGHGFIIRSGRRDGREFMLLGKMKRQQPSCDHRGENNYRAKPVPRFTLDRFVRPNIFHSLDAFRGQLERPCQNQSDGKANHDDEHNEPHRPIWNLEEWKDLCRDLNEQPRDDGVRDGDLVNIAPL